MSAAEKKMLVIILATVALWVLEPLHGIPSVAVGLAGVACQLGFGVCGLKSFRSSLNWESLLFIGTAMGLATVFSYTGIDAWVVNLVGPVMQRLAFSPFAFIAGVALATVVLRFVIASEMAFINIFMAFMAPMAVSLGINPWVVGFAVYAMVNPWFLMYQNPIYMAAFYSVDGRMVNHGPTLPDDVFRHETQSHAVGPQMGADGGADLHGARGGAIDAEPLAELVRVIIRSLSAVGIQEHHLPGRVVGMQLEFLGHAFLTGMAAPRFADGHHGSI